MDNRTAYTIRAYEDGDLDEVIAVFVESIRQVAIRDYNEAQIAAWAQVDRDAWRSCRLSCPTWVALDRQMIVGFSDLKPDGHLDMMYVHPSHQRRGIASSLLRVIENAARNQGLSGICVDASLTSRPFFGNRGFNVQETQRIPLRGQILCNFRMYKPLR